MGNTELIPNPVFSIYTKSQTVPDRMIMECYFPLSPYRFIIFYHAPYRLITLYSITSSHYSYTLFPFLLPPFPSLLLLL